jgi:O-antigen/teichoic acid export membrane protein
VAVITPSAPSPHPPPVDAATMRGVARGGIAGLLGTVFTGVAGLGTTWLVARGLGAHHAGAFFTATAAFVVAGGVAKLGTQTSLVYYPARLRALGAADEVRRCLRVALVPVGLVSGLIGIGLWWTGGLLAVLAPLVPAAALSDAVLAATRGYRQMRPTVVYDRILRPALQLAGLGSLCLVHGSPGWFALAWAAPYVPSLLLGLRTLGRLSRPVGNPGSSTFDTREFWAYSGTRGVAGIAQLALQRVDVMLVAVLAGLPAAALYAVAGRFVILGQFVNQAISQVIQPRLAETLSTGDTVTARHYYRTATGWLVLTSWPLYLLVGAYAPVYLALFGPDYARAGAVTTVLAAAMLVATACGMVDMVLAMGGRTTWNLANTVLALVVTVVADLALIPRLGALGAAIGLAAAVLTNNLLPLAQIGYALRLHPFGRGTLTAAALAVACFGVPAVVTRIAVGDRPAALTVAGAAVTAAGALAYLLAAHLLRRTLRLTDLKGK